MPGLKNKSKQDQPWKIASDAMKHYQSTKKSSTKIKALIYLVNIKIIYPDVRACRHDMEIYENWWMFVGVVGVRLPRGMMKEPLLKFNTVLNVMPFLFNLMV